MYTPGKQAVGHNGGGAAEVGSIQKLASGVRSYLTETFPFVSDIVGAGVTLSTPGRGAGKYFSMQHSSGESWLTSWWWAYAVRSRHAECAVL